MNPSTEKCPDCGREFPPDSPEGLCPRCLAIIAMEVEEDDLPLGEEIDSAAMPEVSGSTIGRYRLLEQIGEGGFGVVYMAEQREPVNRKVALKIIKQGMDTRQVIARFEAERQALAMMDHPNIARVLDAGSTHSGRPYFVMELVRGIPITKFCDQNKLSVRGRLELFFDACAAVQHAHQKGIIHRDLKPSNVLATMNDDKPMVKIIDFGIAKATAQKLTAQTLFTHFHEFVGTPAYMSPEQAQMNATDVDTRSDIYALGVLLYELLTGRTPFDMEALMTEGREAVFRHVKEVDPPRPSTRMSGLTNEERTAVALSRREAPEKLGRSLRGDLDRVVMKALEKDRRRRYETANSFAHDVRRYLANEPVTAVAPSALYRLRKFVSRNRVATVAAAVMIVSLVSGLGLALFSYGWEREARAVAEAERQEADAQRQKAKANQERAGRLHYAADMRLAQLALDEWDRGLAMNILKAHVPSGEDADLRGWEWRFLRSQLRNDAMISRRDSEIPIVSLSTNSDGTLLALGRMWGSIEILDAFTLERLRTLQPDSTTGVARVAFVPGGNLLATTVAYDTEIKLWDTSTWSVARSIPRPGGNGSERAGRLVCSPDGRRLAFGVKRGVVRVFSVKNGNVELETPGGGPLAFSPDGRRLAFKGEGRVIVMDLDSGDDPLEIEVPRGRPLTFSPRDGSMLAGTVGTVIALWNSQTGASVLTGLEGHRGRVVNTVFVDEGKTLVSASSDQTIRVWDLDSGKTTAVLKGSLDELWGLTAVPNGGHVITAAKDGTVSRWRCSAPPARDEKRLLTGIKDVVSCYGPDETMIVRNDDDSFALFDWKRLSRVRELDRLGTGIGRVAWSPEKQLLVAFPEEGDRMLVWSNQGGIVATPKRPEQVRDAAFVGELFLTLDHDQSTSAWDTNTWERADDRARVWKAIFEDFRNERHRFWGLQRFTVSPDGRLVALWSGKGGILWYSLEDGTRLAAELVHREWPWDFAFSASGEIAASASTGCRVVLWRSEPPEIIDTIRAAGQMVALSPDGSRLLTGNNFCSVGPHVPIKLWDVATRRHLQSLGRDGEVGHLSGIGFLPDGNGIFGITEKGLHVWSVPTLAEIDRGAVGGE